MTTTDLTLTFDADAARTCAATEWRDAAESFGGYGDLSFAQTVESLVYAAHEAGLVTGGQPLLWISEDQDGSGMVVTIDLPNGLRLASGYEESRNLVTDRAADGIDAAVDVVGRVVEVADGLVRRYDRLTVPAPVQRKTWPDTSAEREAFGDWQTEVSNGDTVLGFRDWLDARDIDSAE